MAGSVRFVKQYTNNSNGRVFRQYERVDTGRRVDIIMRDDRQARWNYTQAEATAEAKRRLGVTAAAKPKAASKRTAAKRTASTHKHRWRTINGNRVCMDCKTRVRGGD